MKYKSNKSNQPLPISSFGPVKLFQYAIYLISILFLTLSVACSHNKCSEQLQIPYQDLFKCLFFNITDDVLSLNGVVIFSILQTLFLIIFFFISLLLGLKILPIRLTEMEKMEILQSPYSAFNKIFFSKILFGRVKYFHRESFDFRNVKLNIIADLYLLHFKLSNKGEGLIFIFFILFITPIFLPFDNKAPYFQLLINFLDINIALFLMLEFTMFSFSKLLTKGNRNEF